MNSRQTFLLALLGGTLLILGPAAGQPPPRGGPPGRPGPGRPPQGSERLLDDLSLTRRDRDRAHDALAAYDETVRKSTEQARQDLLGKMKAIVPDAEYRKFKDELASVPLLANRPASPRGVPEDDLVERLLALDANRDGRVTIDELPERMRSLLERGDRNRDGALDRDEIRQLAATQSLAAPGRGGAGPTGRGGRGG